MSIRKTLGALCIAAVVGAVWAPPVVQAIDANVGFSMLIFVCPGPTEIDFSWPPATGAHFYSLQLVGPLDSAANRGITGTYLRQFGTIEVAKGDVNNAKVLLASDATAQQLSFQLMLGGPHGYLGLVPRRQTVDIPLPCTQTTVQITVR